MTKPDFTGHWQFDSEASALQIEIPETIEVLIEHNGSQFRLERTFVFAGHSDTFTIELELDTDNPPISRGASTLYPSLHWDGNRLVFLTRIESEGREAENLVRCHLESNGAILVAVESFRGPSREYDNRWVFTKK